MTETVSAPVPDLTDAKVKPIKWEKWAFLSRAGELQKCTFLVSFPELAERWNFDRLLSRHDFDIDDELTPGQRDISPTHVQAIMEGIVGSRRPFIGTLTIAMNAADVEIEPFPGGEMGANAALVKVTAYDGSPNPVAEDGQHRIAMASKLWPLVRDDRTGQYDEIRRMLEETSVEMTLLLEGDKDILSTIFVQMGSTKPISQSLIAVMDTSKAQNRLGLYFMRQSKLLENRVTYLGVAASKKMAESKRETFDALYGAAAVRSAASSMAGVGFRDRTPILREKGLRAIISQKAARDETNFDTALEQSAKELVGLLDEAGRAMPGWKQLMKGSITVAQFKRDYVHSAAVGLHVIANVICAARVANVSTSEVIKAAAELPWRRDDLRPGRDDQGQDIMVHQFFEGTLVHTEQDAKTGDWVGGTGGATRSNYEAATAKILRHIAQTHPYLKEIAEPDTLKALGLSTGERGRPKKKA